MRLLLSVVLVILTQKVQADLKIAVFDMESAIHATTDGKRAKRKLMKEFKFLESRLKKQEFGLREKMIDFEKKAMILSESKRASQKLELQKLSMDFQKNLKEFQVAIQKRQQEETQPIIKKMIQIVGTLAKKNHYDLVLNKSTQNIIWAKKSIDITKELIKSYENLDS